MSYNSPTYPYYHAGAYGQSTNGNTGSYGGGYSNNDGNASNTNYPPYAHYTAQTDQGQYNYGGEQGSAYDTSRPHDQYISGANNQSAYGQPVSTQSSASYSTPAYAQATGLSHSAGALGNGDGRDNPASHYQRFQSWNQGRDISRPSHPAPADWTDRSLPVTSAQSLAATRPAYSSPLTAVATPLPRPDEVYRHRDQASQPFRPSSGANPQTPYSAPQQNAATTSPRSRPYPPQNTASNAAKAPQTSRAKTPKQHQRTDSSHWSKPSYPAADVRTPSIDLTANLPTDGSHTRNAAPAHTESNLPAVGARDTNRMDIGEQVYVASAPQPATDTPASAKNKGGRPKGSKNKPRSEQTATPDENKKPTAKKRKKKDQSATDGQSDEPVYTLAQLKELRTTNPAKWAEIMGVLDEPVTQPAQDPSPVHQSIAHAGVPQQVPLQMPQATFQFYQPPNVAQSPLTSTPTPATTKKSAASRPAAAQQSISGTTKSGKSKKPKSNQNNSTAPTFIDLSDTAEAAAFSGQAGASPQMNHPSSTGQSGRPIPPKPREYMLQPPQSTAPSSNPTSNQQRQSATPKPHAGGPKGGPVNWPESRRNLVTNVCKTNLEALPQNQGKILDMNFFKSLLDRQPNYDQLCGELEAVGWNFDRVELAQKIFRVLGGDPARDAPVANISRPLSSPYTSQGVKPGAYHINPQPSPRPTLQAAHPAPSSASHTVVTAPPVTNVLTTTPASTLDASKATDAIESVAAAIPPSMPLPREAEPTEIDFSVVPIGGDASGTFHTGQIAVKPAIGPVIPQPRPEPRNKQEAARKRTFADFIDITDDNDDDDDEEEKRLLEHARKRAAMAQPSDRFSDKPAAPSRTTGATGTTGASRMDKVSRMERFKAGKAVPGVTSAREALRNDKVVLPLDPAKARRTNSYDPRTIARDFLLAKGEHPYMQPLNWHMESLYHTFKTVNTDSDLDTVRWDLIDPGDAPFDSMHAVQPVEHHPAAHIPTAPAIAKTQKPRNDGHDSDSSSDQGDQNGMIMPAAAKPVEQSERPLDHSAQAGEQSSDELFVSMKRPKTDGMVNSFTTPSNTDGPGETNRRGRGGRPKQVGRPSRGTRVAQNLNNSGRVTSSSNPTTTPASFIDLIASADDDTNSSHGSMNARSPARHTVRNMATPVHRPRAGGMSGSSERRDSDTIVIPDAPQQVIRPVNKSGSPATVTASGKRLGRPPGSKNKTPGPSNSGSPSAQSPPRRDGGHGAKRRGRPPGVRASSTRGRGTSRSRGRGRPRGVAPVHYQLQVLHAMPRDGIGVFVPAITGRHEYRRSHRPDADAAPQRPRVYDPKIISSQRDRRYGHDNRIHHPAPEAYPPVDSFQVFRCRWHACRSELHNLDTLRRHVFRIHLAAYNRDPNRSVECHWYSCCNDGATKEVHSDHARPATGLQFESLRELEEHVEDEHVFGIAQKQGDGPTIKPKAIDPAVFLCDPATGKPITPAARRFGEGPPDPLLQIEHENAAEFSRAYHKAHGHLTKESRMLARVYSQMAWAADERRLESQGGRPVNQWKQMNMSGLRVEVPLSERMRSRFEIPLHGSEQALLDTWRDPDPEEELEKARLELKERKRRYEISEESSSEEEDEGDSGGGVSEDATARSDKETIAVQRLPSSAPMGGSGGMRDRAHTSLDGSKHHTDHDHSMADTTIAERTDTQRGAHDSRAISDSEDGKDTEDESDEEEEDEDELSRPAMFTSPGRFTMNIMSQSTLGVGPLIDDSESESSIDAMDIRRDEP